MTDEEKLILSIEANDEASQKSEKYLIMLGILEMFPLRWVEIWLMVHPNSHRQLREC